MDVISVSSKGQIVIPERVRKSMKIKEGSKLVLFEHEGTITLKREGDVEKMLSGEAKKESLGWMILGEKSLKEVWDNPKDEKTWSKYL